MLSWNLFHCRDGLPGLGPDAGSVLLGRPVDDGRHLHLNRKLVAPMAARIGAAAVDLVALQEVPTGAVRELAVRTGMRPLAAATGPLIGPRRLRDALGRRNPDLWRSHEGNANVLLVAPRLDVVGGPWRLTLNPTRLIAAEARRLRLGAAEIGLWLTERRRAVIAALEAPAGGRLVVACLHCHNARDRRVNAGELLRAAVAVERIAGGHPALIAGDVNLPPGDAVFEQLAGRGWTCPAEGLGIDRVIHRGVVALDGPRHLPRSWREATVAWRGGRRTVVLSDHDAVLARYGRATASGCAAGPPSGR